ncbi:MAG TPA: hypothetical protein VIK51_07475 [Vicinamibacteria bacterium]|jgi:hypothetical protein
MKRVMKGKAWMASVAAALCVLLVLSGAAAAEAQAAFTPERSPAPGSRTYANASLVAIDAKARRITVRAGGKDETFPVEAEALQRVGALKPGEQVVLTLRAGGLGPEVVTQIERSVAASPAPTGKASGRTAPRRVPKPPSAAASPTSPEPPSAPAPAIRPTPASSPAIRPAPSPQPSRSPADTVLPLRDPRRDAHIDPRQDPHRDPRVVPGLTQPAPTPTPSPSPRD